ncbi:MAG: YmdB family metallophosphoesterase [Alphaproteobacteria bacterium]|nr:MAG: YmdB family metallophosphoesterase [Alphaproteobacteria bacterium]
MRILFFGDIFGRTAREALASAVPDLKARLRLDLVVANAENASGGSGLTAQNARELRGAGISVLTMGNHVWKQREILSFIDADPFLLRPLNYPEGTPGRGSCLVTLPDGQRILVAQAIGRVTMDPLVDDPFAAMNRLLGAHRLGQTVQAILVDIHAEATSEKMCMGHFLDGRVTAVIGTHTHIPTADAQILPGGTGFQTDAGMCGDYDSAIGVRKEIALHGFIRKIPGERYRPAEGPATLCGVLIETRTDGLCARIAPIRLGGRLAPAMPDW